MSLVYWFFFNSLQECVSWICSIHTWEEFQDTQAYIGYGIVYKCKLLFYKDMPNFVKIVKRWKQFCKYVKFKKGDDIVFVFERDNEHYTHVIKM